MVGCLFTEYGGYMSTSQKSTMFRVLFSLIAMSYNQPKPLNINVVQVVHFSAPTFPFENATWSLTNKTNSF